MALPLKFIHPQFGTALKLHQTLHIQVFFRESTEYTVLTHIGVWVQDSGKY